MKAAPSLKGRPHDRPSRELLFRIVIELQQSLQRLKSDFLARLAALVPSPGVNLTRYHGVFAPNHRLRALLVPSKRGGSRSGEGQGSAVPKHAAMSWAQRLKRVFGIEIECCDKCGGAVKIIASIEEPQLIGRILEHLGLHGSNAHGQPLPPARASPLGSSGLFD
jgi:hypothetical protein